MKSLFKLIVYICKPGFVFEFQHNQLFNNKSWVRDLSLGKNPREIPFDAEAEVTQMPEDIVKILKA